MAAEFVSMDDWFKEHMDAAEFFEGDESNVGDERTVHIGNGRAVVTRTEDGPDGERRVVNAMYEPDGTLYEVEESTLKAWAATGAQFYVQHKLQEALASLAGASN